VGYLVVDPRSLPDVKGLERRLLELTERVDGLLDTLQCKDSDGRRYTVFGVEAPEMTDGELLRRWEQFLADYRGALRRGPGQRRRRRF